MMLRVQKAAFLLCLTLATPILAQPSQTTWLGGVGDWGDEQQWSNGTPTQSRFAVIQSGDVGAFQVFSPPSAFALDVGRSLDNENADGVLTAHGTDLVLITDLSVAENRGGGVAIGKIVIRQDGKVGGNLFADDVQIGSQVGFAGAADGVVEIDRDIFVGNPESSLVVGRSLGDGTATGHLIVGGDIGNQDLGYQAITIGHFGGGVGSAFGSVDANRLSRRGGTLTVGLNTGQSFDSLATGQLHVDELSGYQDAFFGISETGAAKALASVESFYNVSHTEVGSTNRRGTATLMLGDQSIADGQTMNINRGSHVSMGAMMGMAINNSGLLSVTDRPDGDSGGIVEVIKPFTQTSSGILALDVNGPVRGLGYESLVLEQGGVLDGRVRLNFADGFAPKEGQVFELITSNGNLEQKNFRWSLINPPKDLAVRFLQDEGIVAEVVAPIQQAFVNANGANFEWNDGGIWTNKVPPSSIDDIAMVNDRKVDQSVIAAPLSMLRTLNVDGNTNAMSLTIPRGSTLSATHDINIASKGQILLENGSILTSKMQLGPGAEFIARGELVGSLVNKGRVALGPPKEPAQLTIDGDFIQLPQGWLDMDVLGTKDGQFDEIFVDGKIDLNGTININIPDREAIGFNAQIPLLTATQGIFGSLNLKFENLVGEIPLGLQSFSDPNSDEVVMFMISGSSPGILGDMNWDGFVDECDLDAFALSLQNPDAYTDRFIFNPSHIGDIGDDGAFDVDDIQPFFELVNGVSCEVKEVPEPTGVYPIVAIILGCLVARRRRVSQRKG